MQRRVSVSSSFMIDYNGQNEQIERKNLCKLSNKADCIKHNRLLVLTNE